MKDRKKRDRKQAEQIIAVAEATREVLLGVTVPLYQGERDGVPEVAGSGVLVELVGMRFLVTAGHVLDLRAKGQLVVGLSPELFTLSGEPMRLRTPGSTVGMIDRVDIGVVHLQGGPWDSIPVSRFIGWDRLDTEIPIMAKHSYVLVGFPHSMNRKSLSGNTLNAYAISIGGLECDQEAYESTHCDPQLSVMVGIDREALWTAEGQRTGPDLYGSSGCGLWRYGRYIRTSVGPPRLSAIGIEWHRKGRHRHVLGTRIHIVIGAIADKYPAVRELLNKQQRM